MRKKPKSSKKVVLGMSGGVDSSVALVLLQKAGYEVIGVSLKYDVWRCSSRSRNRCCTPEAFLRARKLCGNYGVPYRVIDVRDRFDKNVIEYFKFELKNNRTPSPCVFCNPRVKMSALLKEANRMGADFISTGHYARVQKIGDEFYLKKARDKSKDQTYSLSFLGQKELSKLVLPLGDLTKSAVYKIAKKSNGFEDISIAPESQDFCFLGKGQLKDFIKKEIKPREGRIVDQTGKILGRHPGLEYFTIGQRKDINLPGGPYYVICKKLPGTLIVSLDKKDAMRNRATLKPYNLINPIKGEQRVNVKNRSREPEIPATLTVSKSNIKLELSNKSVLTDGQVCVFYKANICLGSGIINL